MKTNGNDPANPTIGWELTVHGDPVVITDQYGLTKREYFAAMVMQGLMANPNMDNKDNLEELAVLTADFLIEELNKDE